MNLIANLTVYYINTQYNSYLVYLYYHQLSMILIDPKSFIRQNWHTM